MIDLLFSLLNVAILVAIFGFLFKRSVPTLKAALEAQKEIEADIHDEHHNLILSQNHLDESTRHQEEECVKLLGKINQWKASVASVTRGRESEAVVEQQELEKKLARQSDEYSLDMMYKKVSPQVVAELEASLRTYFSDEKNAHAYVDRFIKELKK